ncbi:uncharacterized protein LOC114281810 [Camellia sinensis]|uniref:uncharacterized protein LOC114281810 n=1 Tax=Camellia sinensis TaxID=4442 RepID=UPI001036122F|nr:uncharacterized protein LOC114281810 [Camellia sinensis]
MEVLARILAEKSRNPLFKFHWRCEKAKIVNLCFADDLMIFSKGDLGTVNLIMQGLEEFRNLSGLTPNPSKSNIFFSGCSIQLREEILQIAKLTEGSLPVRYLGVPLITTKLKVSDCHILVERITMRIKSWTNKLLSYAGRAQLIKSILFSMQVYWSSLFILPKKIVSDIESILRSFFWSGVEMKKHSAKIAWKYICRNKSEGGLGFKDLEVWNKATIAKHVWYLFSGGDCSMWCQWVKSYLLKGRSFWSVKTPSDPSWRFGPRILYDTNLPDSSKVSSIVSNCSWKWPVSNSWEIKEWISSTPSSLLPSPGSSNTPVWSLTADGTFSIQSVWDWWREKGPKVPWSKLIWGPPLIPRVSFIVWLAINERLNTGDRLQSFGLVSNPCCPFCQAPEEDHSHLFFRCIFSSRVWGGMMANCNANWPSLSWLGTVEFATKSTCGNSLKMLILRLSFLCTVYHIWMERNSRIFSKVHKPEEVVTNSIIQMVRGRLLSLDNIKFSAGDHWFLEKWNLPYKIMQPTNATADGSLLSYQVMMNPISLKWLIGGLSDVYGAFKYTTYLVLLRNLVRCGPSDVRFYMECKNVLYCGPSVGRSYTVCLLFLLLYDLHYGGGDFYPWQVVAYVVVRWCGSSLFRSYLRLLTVCFSLAVEEWWLIAVRIWVAVGSVRMCCLQFAYSYGLCRRLHVYFGVSCNRCLSLRAV